ncbi:MAG: glycosyltransferase family 1 protein [Smithella sp.]|nr:glycosyltransferase family 1 protein [Smithella sp.]
MTKILLRIYSSLMLIAYKHPQFRRLGRWVLSKNEWLKNILHEDAEEKYAKLEAPQDYQQIFVDVTHLYNTGLKTGIQRVVLSLYEELKDLAKADYRISSVVLSSDEGLWHFRYCDLDKGHLENDVVVPIRGDIFLGLDLNAQVIAPIKAGLFRVWKRKGVKIVFTAHDILPITNPEWFPPFVPKAHEEWLKTIIEAGDHILSVSETTQKSVIKWAHNNQVDVHDKKFSWFHHGADFDRNKVFDAECDVDQGTLAKIKEKITFLHVSTIEPRKGHWATLNAFEKIWLSNDNVALVFVGARGWMCEKVVSRIDNHPYLNEKLFWLSGISDNYLSKVYENADCLLHPSEGEGFGLSLIEGANKGLSLIVRDIPIFREVAGDKAVYFQSDQHLPVVLEDWLANACLKSKNTRGQSVIPTNSWRESAQIVWQKLVEN